MITNYVRSAKEGTCRQIFADFLPIFRQRAEDIVLKYFSSDSDCEINIDFQIKKGVMKKISNPTLDMFDEAQASLYQLLVTDSVPKYLHSPQYNMIKKKIKEEKLVKLGKMLGDVPEEQLNRQIGSPTRKRWAEEKKEPILLTPKTSKTIHFPHLSVWMRHNKNKT
jgi:hypothetical protein